MNDRQILQEICDKFAFQIHEASYSKYKTIEEAGIFCIFLEARNYKIDTRTILKSCGKITTKLGDTFEYIGVPLGNFEKGEEEIRDDEGTICLVKINNTLIRGNN